jgi:hypothetical protein
MHLAGIPDDRDADGQWKQAQQVRKKTRRRYWRAASSAGGAFVGPGQTTRIALCRGSRRWAELSFS